MLLFFLKEFLEESVNSEFYSYNGKRKTNNFKVCSAN